MTIQKIQLSAELDQLRQERVRWEDGNYKTSNEQLYAILEKCAGLYAQALENKDFKAAIANSLANPVVSGKRPMTLLERIMNDVFGRVTAREKVYIRAIKVWLEEQKPDEAFPCFVKRRGGVESISRTSTKRVSQSLTPVQYRQIAESVFREADALTQFGVTAGMRSDDTNEGPYLVALVRMDDQGMGQIVHASNKTKLVNDALAIFGRQVDRDRLNQADETAQQERLKKRTEDIAAFVRQGVHHREAA